MIARIIPHLRTLTLDFPVSQSHFAARLAPTLHSDTQSENPYPTSKSNFCNWSEKFDMDRCITTPVPCPCSQLILSCTFFWKFQFFKVHIYRQKSSFTRAEEILKQRKRRPIRKPCSRSNEENSIMLGWEQKLKGKNKQKEEIEVRKKNLRRKQQLDKITVRDMHLFTAGDSRKLLDHFMPVARFKHRDFPPAQSWSTGVRLFLEPTISTHHNHFSVGWRTN